MKKKPTIPIKKKTPGKVFAYNVGFNPQTGKLALEDTHVTIKNSRSRVKKDSSQPVDAQYSVNFIAPFVHPDTMRMHYCQSVSFYRCVKLLELCTLKLGSNITPLDESLKKFKNDAEYQKLDSLTSGTCNHLSESFEDVIGGWGNDWKTFGNGFMEMVPAKGGGLAELYNLRAYETRIGFDNRFRKFSDGLFFVQLLKNRTAKRFKFLNSRPESDENEVIMIKNYNPFCRFYGFPDGYPATSSLALDRAQEEFNLKEFSNDMMISFVIIVEGGELDDKAMIDIQDFLTQNYKGVGNSNKALLLSTDDPNITIKIEKVSKENRDSSYDKLADRCNTNVMLAFGILSPLLGIKTPGSLGNASELEVLFKFFNETIIQPEKRKVQLILNNLFKTRFGISKFKWELRELTYETFLDMIQYARDLTQAGIISEDEGRVYLGYKARKEDDGNKIDKIEKGLRLIRRLQKQLEEYSV
jgi:HK97 family phage portal protein